MKLKISCIFCAIALSNFIVPSENVVTTAAVLQIGMAVKEVVTALTKAWGIVDSNVDFDIPVPLLEKTEKRFFRRLNIISAKIDEISEKIDSVDTHLIYALLNTLPERMRLELRLNDLYGYINRINDLYEKMEDYAAESKSFEKYTLEDYARSIVTHEGESVINLLDRIHSFIVPQGEGLVRSGILDILLKSFEEVNDMICSNNQSPQQVLYSLYNTIALTELKGYTMIQFSYMLLKLYGEGNFTKESNIVRSRFEARTNKALEVVKYAMHDASRDYWRCDPRKHVKGETYEEITQLLQGYVQNEVDMNPDGTCRENCGEYQYAKSYGCFQNQFCSQQRRCNGKILNCKYVDSDMKICTSDIKSGRRYESIEYENGLVYGRKQACARGTTKVDSWWRWLFWHCSYCICLCDEQGPHSDRYINMRPSIANLEMNRVVTGLRFVKKNRIVHLQIQEGELLPYGNINSTSLQWVEPEDYHIEDYKVYAGQDYHVLSWEKRAVDLDDLQVDHTHVVTGVRFKEVGSHLNFEIYVSPFNFTSGKLDNPLSKSEWRDNLNTELSRKPRTKLNIYNPDIPTRSLTPSEPLSKSDQYLEFVNTDFERDAAQTTIPFLDAQPVASSKPVPLSGAGIFYKGVRHFGGFIAPKVITYDVSEHLKPVFPGPPEDQENAVSLEEINTVSVI